jgi:hypothetical protein
MRPIASASSIAQAAEGHAASPGPRSPKGIAFAISDLLLAQAWAEAHGVSLRIHLDHGSRTEEYEEAITIQAGASTCGRALIWRGECSIFVQPLLGRRRGYSSMSAALEGLLPKERLVLTDIVATSWPNG